MALSGFGSTPQAATSGFSFGGGAATANKPIGIGTTQANTITTSTGLLGGLLASTTTTAATSTGGFSLGTTAPTTSAGGLGGGFGFGAAAPAPASTAGNTGSLGFNFGTSTAATSAATGLTLGAGTSTSSTGFSLGGALGGGGGGLGLGGSTAAATTTSTVSRGLGGINPAATSIGGAAAANINKPGGGDPKASSKETPIPQAVAQTVDEFQKYVKEQKSVRESIARMSCKNLYKVQEEVASLKQVLSLVSNGLQRNAVAISKLKLQSAQELKYAEIAQRTKDTPPGLQYENTAPTEYFQHMVVAFEQQMVTYRQQIEQMETYLSSLHHSAILTPHELSMLLSKLLSSFVSLAAQLQSVHEHVNAQKEHYLNYRKVFQGDSTDVFEKRRGGSGGGGGGAQRVMNTVYAPAAIPLGPTPFHGANNPGAAMAAAMAAAVNKTGHRAPTAAGGVGQQPAGSLGFVVGGGGGLFSSPAQNPVAPTPLVPGLGAVRTGGFGGIGTSSTSSTGFGQQPTATVRPLG